MADAAHADAAHAEMAGRLAELMQKNELLEIENAKLKNDNQHTYRTTIQVIDGQYAICNFINRSPEEKAEFYKETLQMIRECFTNELAACEG